MTAHIGPFWVHDIPTKPLASFTKEEKEKMIARLDQLDLALVAYLKKLNESQKQLEEEMICLRGQMNYITENFLNKN